MHPWAIGVAGACTDGSLVDGRDPLLALAARAAVLRSRVVEQYLQHGGGDFGERILRVLPWVRWVTARRRADRSEEDSRGNMAADALAREHACGVRVEAAKLARRAAELAALRMVHDVFGSVEAAVLAEASSWAVAQARPGVAPRTRRCMRLQERVFMRCVMRNCVGMGRD